MPDGLNVDTLQETGSIFNRQRMKNGWKHSGRSRTSKMTPDPMILPGHK
jgi:hypothetical protein